MNVGRSFFGSALAEGAVWAIGPGIERWDAAAGKWEVVSSDERIPRSHLAAASDGRTIWIIGLGKDVLAFDARTRSLRAIDAWPGYEKGDHFHVVVALGGVLHVIGGLAGKDLRAETAHWVLKDGAWSRLPDAPRGIFAKFAAIQAVDRSVFVFESSAAEGDGDSAGWKFDAGSGAWTKLPVMPSELALPASFVRNGWIHVLGGMPVRKESPTRLAYEIAADRWIVGK
jgi:hypothetical protein